MRVWPGGLADLVTHDEPVVVTIVSTTGFLMPHVLSTKVLWINPTMRLSILVHAQSHWHELAVSGLQAV